MKNALVCIPVAVLGIVLGACNAADVRSPSQAPAATGSTTRDRLDGGDAFGNPYAGQRRTVAGRPYTTEPAEARLGRHVLSFPANYFVNQTGPDFQGAVTLRLQWPAMEPYAPGAAATSDATVRMRDVMVALDVLPESALPDVLVRQVTRQPHEDPDDPRNDLSTRVATPFPDGVTGYSVDPVLMRRFAELEGPNMADQIMNPASPLNDDWFVVRDGAGTLSTVIKCDPKATTEVDMDGLQPVLRPGGRMSRCVHQFLVPELQLRIRMHYSRAYLPEWRWMESRVRSLIATAATQH